MGSPGRVMELQGGAERVGGTSQWSGTGRETLGEVRDGSRDPPRGKFRGTGEPPYGRDGSGDPRGSPGRVGGSSGRSGTGWRTLGAVRDWSRDLGEVRDRWVDPQVGPGHVGGPLGRSVTSRGTLWEVGDGLGHRPWGSGRVWENSLRSGTGLKTSKKSQDRSGEPQGGLGWVGDLSGRVGTGQSTFGKVGTGRETHKKFWDRSRDPRGGPGRMGGPSGRSEMGRGTLWEVQDGSGNLREVRDG